MAKKTPRREAREAGKPARVPLGGRRAKLQLSEADRKEFDRRKMIPRWVNDEGGRIQAALAGGYNFVDPKYATSLGHGVLTEGNTDEGARVSKIVTRAGPDGPAVRGYLMEIKEKLWKEDQETKEERNAQTDRALSLGEGGADDRNQYGPGVTFTH
ncbi:MAG: hypothetical protein ACYSP9_08270 [Planctomycetota bacterium]|jgi:hypothetical protein